MEPSLTSVLIQSIYHELKESSVIKKLATSGVHTHAPSGLKGYYVLLAVDDFLLGDVPVPDIFFQKFEPNKPIQFRSRAQITINCLTQEENFVPLFTMGQYILTLLNSRTLPLNTERGLFGVAVFKPTQTKFFEAKGSETKCYSVAFEVLIRY